MTTTLYALGAITISGYQVATGDRTTAGSVVSGALVEAEGLLEEELNRSLALDERTAPFWIYPDGRVYPDAWPLVSADLEIEGRALLGGTPDVTAFIGFLPGPMPNRATVTWTGGYDDGTNGTRLPYTLAHAIYDLARTLAADSSPVPVGATSMSVGDASITFASPSSGGLDALVPGLSARVRPYRNRNV